MAGMTGAAAGLAGGAWSGAALAAAPQIGPATPTHYRFKLGEFEVTTISDGAVQVEGPHPIFGENVSAAEVQALAAQNFLPPDKMVIGFAPVVVNTGKELVLFDTGNGVARRPDAGRLASLLATAGFQPEQIDVVVLSHFHPDHVGGLMENGQALLPNARYVTAAAEYDFWSPARPSASPPWSRRTSCRSPRRPRSSRRGPRSCRASRRSPRSATRPDTWCSTSRAPASGWS
jgi:glyoxylase-like metal-dependent hydrolase (beta-lactamase superfamily II)